MPTRLFEGVALVEVHVVSNGDPALSDLNLVERILFLLAASSAAGGCGSTLGDDDASVSMRPWIEVQRVPYVGSVQVPAQNHINFQIRKSLDCSFRVRHVTIAQVVRCGCEMMVSHDDPCDSAGRLAQSSLAEVQLPLKDLTVADRGTRCGRVQADDHSSFNPEYRIQFLGDDLTIESVWIEQAFAETIERNIVVPWNNQLRNRGQSFHILFGRYELFPFGALR